MYWENQLELPSDKGSNRSRGTTRDIGRGPIRITITIIELSVALFVYLLIVVSQIILIQLGLGYYK